MDVDQYTRNHLTEPQILDTERLTELVATHAKPLITSELGEWAQGLDTRNVVERWRGCSRQATWCVDSITATPASALE